ncbi:cache domain-containing sensor histidine kinase [Paenibacillus nasutitermitis]|uniref:histidine kinase n=1 Tax=Paenibacillus nasutitermitis TaxID=1652958 RepID=A0A916YM10_9BACL|nr:sensor histidine kinase [Paenibacillus nasutitermitis]GGD50195.1 sensor histidine kinase YesM [Paenibacillus nasutitermitis]
MEERQKQRITISINQRLLILIVFFICFPFFIIGWSWYRSSTETIEQNAIQTNKRIIEQTNEYLDLYLSNLANSTYPFVNNALIQTFMDSPSLSAYQYFQLSEDVENDLFSQMIYGRSDIVGISVAGRNGRQINDYSTAKEMLDMRPIRARNTDYLSKIDTLDDFQVVGLGKVGKTPVVTVARKLHSNTTYRYEGMLIVDLSLQQIENICRNVSLGSFNVWISTIEGEIVYHSDPSLMGTHISDTLLERVSTGGPDYFRIQQSGEEKFMIYEFSKAAKWILVADIPLHKIIGNLIYLRNLSLTAAAVMLILTLGIVGGFSLSLTRPLKLLQRLMAKVESGDFTVRQPVSRRRKDEIGSVFQSFYQMVSELRRLVSEVHSSKLKEQELTIRQKESALQAMQAHINPHFLYNSLEIINSHAIVEGNREISRMTAALAHMFRYNIGNARNIVTLQEELAHIRSYLAIQQARFSKLSVEIDMDESLTEHIEAVRMTLQPLVENAFIHGYKNKKPVYIGIAGRAEESWYSVLIEDRGVGMDPERHEWFNLLFLQGQQGLSPGNQTSGIGLMNVHQRLQLTFGPAFGLRVVHSSSGTGTIFEIRLPNFREGEKTHVQNDDN